MTSKIELYQGSCTEIMKTLNEESVHLIITSPPYFNARDYSSFQSYEDYLNWTEKWIQECFRILKNGRMLIINTSSVIEPRKTRSHRSVRYNIPADTYYICKKLGFWFCEELIWEKPEGAAINRNQRFSIDRNPLQWKANPNTERILVVQKPSNFLNDKIIRSYEGKSKITGFFDRGEVFKFNAETSIDHPAPFPIQLPNIGIKYYTWESDIVCDPFMGSGTTGVACINANRNFIGMEKDEKYFNMAKERIDKAQLTFEKTK